MDTKKAMNELWTARWYLDNTNPITKEPVRTHVSNALAALGDKPAVVVDESEPDRPSIVMPDDFGLTKIEQPNFVEVKGAPFVNRGFYKTKTGMFSGLVVHYTVSNRKSANAKGVLNWLHYGDGKYSNGGLMCMVMDENGVIYLPEGFDPLRHWGHHAGVSKWGNLSSVSSHFAGMEICCWGKDSKVGPFRESKGEANIIAGKYQTFTEAQEKALINFIMWAKKSNPEFSFENVVGHDELRAQAGKRGDKQDPGASLSWTMPEFRGLLEQEWKQVGA
jgi:hypothetical protein